MDYERQVIAAAGLVAFAMILKGIVWVLGKTLPESRWKAILLKERSWLHSRK